MAVILYFITFPTEMSMNILRAFRITIKKNTCPQVVAIQPSSIHIENCEWSPPTLQRDQKRAVAPALSMYLYKFKGKGPPPFERTGKFKQLCVKLLATLPLFLWVQLDRS